MLEKRKSRGGGGGGDGSSVVDDWNAPPVVKAQMAFEIIWFCIILYLISALIKVVRNVPSRHRQPYILLLVSAILLDIGLIMDAVAIRTDDITDSMTSLALSSVIALLLRQPRTLFTMAGLWVFRKRSHLIIYGKGATGIPYAGQMWKFVVDWMVTSFGLLFLVLSVIVDSVGYSLYWNFVTSYADYKNLYNASVGLVYVHAAFYFILTIIFVVTAITLSGAFKRQMGQPDVVTRLMLLWVMPWLISRAFYTLIDTIISGTNKSVITPNYLYSLALSRVIVNGAFACFVLYGFTKTVAEPGPWDWSHIQPQQPQQPQAAPYSVQAYPAQLAYYPHPSTLPQGSWGQNNNQQQHAYQPYTPPQPPV